MADDDFALHLGVLSIVLIIAYYKVPKVKEIVDGILFPNGAPSLGQSSSSSSTGSFTQISNGNVSISGGTHSISKPIDSATAWGNNVTVNGQGIDKTVISAAHSISDDALVHITSNITLRNLTIDGGYLVKQSLSCASPVNFTMENCKIIKGSNITSWFGGQLKNFVVRNCIITQGGHGDLQALTSRESGLFENNILDRAGSTDEHGSCLTAGFGKNIIVRNNTMTRPASAYNTAGAIGFSLESWEQPGYDNITITGNRFINSNLKIGGNYNSISYTLPITNIKILSNSFQNARINFFGPDASKGIGTGLGYNQIRNITMQNNTFNNPPGVGTVYKTGMVRI